MKSKKFKACLVSLSVVVIAGCLYPQFLPDDVASYSTVKVGDAYTVKVTLDAAVTQKNAADLDMGKFVAAACPAADFVSAKEISDEKAPAGGAPAPNPPDPAFAELAASPLFKEFANALLPLYVCKSKLVPCTMGHEDQSKIIVVSCPMTDWVQANKEFIISVNMKIESGADISPEEAAAAESSVAFSMDKSPVLSASILGIEVPSADGAADADTSAGVDTDHDTIPNTEDNCPAMKNTSQSDSDNDGVGDVCDACKKLADPTNESDECIEAGLSSGHSGDGTDEGADTANSGGGCSLVAGSTANAFSYLPMILIGLSLLAVRRRTR